MPGNIFGERFVVVSFGESHGKGVGAVVDGVPAGLELSENDIQPDLDLRRPGQSIVTTQRKEGDVVEIMSGVFNGRTTGAPVMMMIPNLDVDSRSYEAMRDTPRPSHADLTHRTKYGGFNDYRGSGRASARVTAGFVMAGAIAKKLLKLTLGVEIIAYTLELGGLRRGVGIVFEDTFLFALVGAQGPGEIALRMLLLAGLRLLLALAVLGTRRALVTGGGKKPAPDTRQTQPCIPKK